MLLNHLVELGLSDKEAAIYIAALSLQATSVQNIAKKANINRVTSYNVIDRLIKDGFMSSYKEGKKFYFYAERPEKVVTGLIKRQEATLEIQKANIAAIIPELSARQTEHRNRPIITYFHGQKEVGAFTENFFLEKFDHTFRILYNQDEFFKHYKPYQLKNFAQKRHKKKVHAKVIRIADSVKDSSQSTMADNFNVPKAILPITNEISVFDQTVRIITTEKEIHGLSIEDRNISESFKHLLDLLWACIEKDSKTNPEIIRCEN